MPESDQHRKRAQPVTSEPSVSLVARNDGRRELTHVTWDDTRVDVSSIRPSGVDRARARFRSQLPELVWNAAALEGNTYTLDGVRALLEGVSAAGKPLDDERQILALSEAYSHLDHLLDDRAFHLDKGTSDALHAILARYEALDAGQFRGEGATNGGGHVHLSDGSVVEGADAGPGGAELRARHEDLISYLDRLPDVRLAALVYFASATRSQFYFDGNKRTARLMMTGHLMAGGYDPVSIPAARKLEFNVALDTMFTSDDATDLLAFLATCTID